MKKVLLLAGSVLMITAGCSMGDSNKEQPKKAMFKTQAEAEAAAPEFGCTGAHQMGEMWMVCEKHEQAGHKGHH